MSDNIIVDTATRIFADLCEPQTVNAAEEGKWPEELWNALEESGLPPGLLEPELTETLLIEESEQLSATLSRLRARGIAFSIDDFGTGYSSLAYLTRFPIGALKIDRSFVADVNRDPNAATIVRTIIEMAHSLGFSVVAEGFKTKEQATFLRLLRCEHAQGYLFAKPMPAAELAKLFAPKN